MSTSRIASTPWIRGAPRRPRGSDRSDPAGCVACRDRPGPDGESVGRRRPLTWGVRARPTCGGERPSPRSADDEAWERHELLGEDPRDGVHGSGKRNGRSGLAAVSDPLNQEGHAHAEKSRHDHPPGEACHTAGEDQRGSHEGRDRHDVDEQIRPIGVIRRIPVQLPAKKMITHGSSHEESVLVPACRTARRGDEVAWRC